ncbi:MAG: hypothetical protein KDI39_07955 [Pseudomonadales bacterium]|jgi:hypothetical protein|nr:hypothetical protein [Pseudomonadales bacterium]
MMNNFIKLDEPMLPPDSQTIVIEKPQIGQFTSNLIQTLHETVGDFASIGLIDTQAMHIFDVLGLSLPQIKGQEHG